jgi:hypothetical protein
MRVLAAVRHELYLCAAISWLLRPCNANISKHNAHPTDVTSRASLSLLSELIARGFCRSHRTFQ